MTRITDMHGDLQAESSWVVVQVTTCRGRGHIVAAALQATQLVNVFCFILYTLSQTRVQSSSLSVFLRN